MSFQNPCLETVHDLSHYHEIPWKLEKATPSKEKCSRLLVKQEDLLQILFEAHRLLELRTPSLYLEGAFVDTKNVTMSLQHQKLHGATSCHK